MRTYGIDFSGARRAGEKIWIASGVAAHGAFCIDRCQRAADLPSSAPDRDRALSALRSFIASADAAVFGCDFPLGLPRSVIDAPTWAELVQTFHQRYPTPDSFREECFRAAGGAELRRATDVETATPFSPYNLRMYRQTYFGIRDVVGPLVTRDLITVRPMLPYIPDRSILIEVCPASTLKREGLYLPYKGKSPKQQAAREHILDALVANHSIQVAQPIRTVAIEDAAGDALDSLIAASAAFRALPALASDPSPSVTSAFEGHVYT